MFGLILGPQLEVFKFKLCQSLILFMKHQEILQISMDQYSYWMQIID
jgi:hypothetical protein